MLREGRKTEDCKRLSVWRGRQFDDVVERSCRRSRGVASFSGKGGDICVSRGQYKVSQVSVPGKASNHWFDVSASFVVPKSPQVLGEASGVSPC